MTSPSFPCAPADQLTAAVRTWARNERVVVASDFDGTLAPFHRDPMCARAVPGALDALRAAARLPGVTVALVSGRDLRTLGVLTGLEPGPSTVLIGSHGSETSCGDVAALIPGLRGLRDEVARRLAAVTARHPGSFVEHKPAAAVLHTRPMLPVDDAVALEEAAAAVADLPGVHLLPGKHILECSVIRTDKGTALLDLARRVDAQAVMYAGDDVTDEHAFTALAAEHGHLGVKVGDGPTAAAHRVADIDAAVALLHRVVDALSLRERHRRQPDSTDPHLGG